MGLYDKVIKILKSKPLPFLIGRDARLIISNVLI